MKDHRTSTSSFGLVGKKTLILVLLGIWFVLSLFEFGQHTTDPVPVCKCPTCEQEDRQKEVPLSSCPVCSGSPGTSAAAKDPTLVPPFYDGLQDFTTLEYSLSNSFITEVLPRLNNFQEFIHFKVQESEEAEFVFISTTYNEELTFPERNKLNWRYAKMWGHHAAHCYSKELAAAFGDVFNWKDTEHLWKIPCLYGAMMSYPQYQYVVFIDHDAFISPIHFHTPFSNWLDHVDDDRSWIMHDRIDFNSGVFIVRNNFHGRRLMWLWLQENLLGIWRHIKKDIPKKNAAKGQYSFLSDQMALVSIWFDEVKRAAGERPSHFLRKIIDKRDPEGLPGVVPQDWRKFVLDEGLRKNIKVWKPFWHYNDVMGQFWFLSPLIKPPFQPEYQSFKDGFFVHPAGNHGRLREPEEDLLQKIPSCPDHFYGAESKHGCVQRTHAPTKQFTSKKGERPPS